MAKRTRSRRAARGDGSIRPITRKVPDGKEYKYWEARITAGYDPGTGEQKQISFTAKTQKEALDWLTQQRASLLNNTFVEPSKLTVASWLDIWVSEYKIDVRPSTLRVYNTQIRNHIKPGLGAIRLCKLNHHTVQAFLNRLDPDLAASSKYSIFKVLRAALRKAVELDYLAKDPTTFAVLQKEEKKEIKPLSVEDANRLMQAAKGTELETVVAIALFTGMRLSEVLGLTWDAVDFTGGTINVNKQLVWKTHQKGSIFGPTKNGKTRILHPAPTAMGVLRRQRALQAEAQLLVGPIWSNSEGLVFTREDGSPLYQGRVYSSFKKLVNSIDLPETRFHDLRHTYAVNAIRAGDDIKSVQGNLGHASAAFTLDRYGHFTEMMKLDSADRMESFIKSNLKL